MKRIEHIDVMKGIGIFLVIVGHTGGSFASWIYSFHMGLFFWIAGFVMSTKTLDTRNILYIKKKIRKVLFPYFCFWSISVIRLYMILKGNVSIFKCIKGLLFGGSYLEYILNFPLWFFELYFISVVIFFFFVKYINKNIQLILMLIVAIGTTWFQSKYPGRPIFHINVLPAALVYCYFGYYSYKLLDKVSNKLYYRISIGLLLMFIGWYISTINGGNISQINSCLYYVGSFCSIIGLYIISRKFEGNEFIKKLGRESMYILGIHSLLSKYASQFVEYVFTEFNISTDSFVVRNIFVAVVTIVLSIAIIDIYTLLKRLIPYYKKLEMT